MGRTAQSIETKIDNAIRTLSDANRKVVLRQKKVPILFSMHDKDQDHGQNPFFEDS